MKKTNKFIYHLIFFVSGAIFVVLGTLLKDNFLIYLGGLFTGCSISPI